MSDAAEQSKISWKRVAIFLIIAISISNIFRFDVFGHKEQLEFLPNWIYILAVIFLEGSGVIIAALIAFFFLKKQRKTEISLFGTSKSKSLLMAIVPVIILTVIGVNNEYGVNPHFYGFYVVIGTLIYCIMEEYGWRGYLQEEFKQVTAWKKYLGIGFIWYLWHLTFLTKATISDNLFLLGILIAGSWAIGQIVESTKSIVASACFHLIVQIMMFNSLIKNGIDGTEKLIILGISIAVWMVIMKKTSITNR